MSKIIFLLTLLLILQTSNNSIYSQLFKTYNISLSHKKSLITDINDDEQEKEESETFRSQLFEVVRKQLKPAVNSSTMSLGCKKMFNKYLFGEKEDGNISYITSNYYINKVLDDSAKHKNDLSSYDQCMLKNYKYKIKSDTGKKRSTYLVLKGIRTNKLDNSLPRYFKNTTDVEKMTFLTAICLPQGYKIDNEEYIVYKNENETVYRYCDDEDYEKFVHLLNDNFNDLFQFNNTNFTYFNIRKKADDDETINFGGLLFKLIPFIIFLIHVIFMIFRIFIMKIFKCFFASETQKKNFVLIKEYEDNDTSESINSDYESVSSTTLKKIFMPKWYKVINNCFNVSENFKELFNFTLNSTSINNDSGVTYIRGLKGLSLISLILGLNYLTLFNSTTKIFSAVLFLDLLKNPLYIIFFYGLRYAPRVMFSCSGYTLTFKYLSYVNKNFSIWYNIKFFLYQIHKYFLLFFFFLFERFSLYYLHSMGDDDNPMWKYFYLNILSKPDKERYGLAFPAISSIFITEDDGKIQGQTLIDYFWMIFNEFLFFVIGVEIITAGFKFKLRIDFFIIILIIICFIAKIILTYLMTSSGEKYYSTLYYYLFDYGKFMLNPLFNLPSFLIGMYFGFMNYSVQKGIISLTNTYNFQNIISKTLENNDEGVGLKESFSQNEKEYCNEIKQMPFLISSVKFVNWHRKKKLRLLIFLLTIFIIFFCTIHFLFLFITTDESDLLLESFITNKLLNFIYRIDIEIMVFIIHWLLFILYFKGKNFINDFFCHVFWAMFNKFYFSFILFANPIILFIFYHSETTVVINLYNLILYSVISGFTIFIYSSFFYIFFELSFKKLIHSIGTEEVNDEEIEENEEENEDDNEEND